MNMPPELAAPALTPERAHGPKDAQSARGVRAYT